MGWRKSGKQGRNYSSRMEEFVDRKQRDEEGKEEKGRKLRKRQ